MTRNEEDPVAVRPAPEDPFIQRLLSCATAISYSMSSPRVLAVFPGSPRLAAADALAGSLEEVQPEVSEQLFG
jgi:hypothetical protein